jgi:hypothetical protein
MPVKSKLRLVTPAIENRAVAPRRPKNAELRRRVAGEPGRSVNTCVQFVCVPAKPIVPCQHLLACR